MNPPPLQFNLVINRRPDGSLNGQPYVTVVGLSELWHVCYGFETSVGVPHLEALVRQANAYAREHAVSPAALAALGS